MSVFDKRQWPIERDSSSDLCVISDTIYAASMSSHCGLDTLPDELLLECASYFSASDDVNARRHVVALAGTSRRAHRVLRAHPEFIFSFYFEVDLALIPDDTFESDELGHPQDLSTAIKRLQILVDAQVPIHAQLSLDDGLNDGACDNSEWETLLESLANAVLGGHIVRLYIAVTTLTGLNAVDDILSVRAPALTELRVRLVYRDDLDDLGEDPVLPPLFDGHAPLLRSVSVGGVALPHDSDMSAFQYVQFIERDWPVGHRWDMSPVHFPRLTTMRLNLLIHQDLFDPRSQFLQIAGMLHQVRHLTIVFDELDHFQHSDEISKWTRRLFPNLTRLKLTGEGASAWRRTISIGETEALDFIDEYIPWESDGQLKMSLSRFGRFDEPTQVGSEGDDGFDWRISSKSFDWDTFKRAKHISVTVQQVGQDGTLAASVPIVSWDTEEKFVDDLSTYSWLAKRIACISFPYNLLKIAGLFVRSEVAELYPRLQRICVDLVGFTHRVRRAKVFDKLDQTGVAGVQNDEAMVWSGTDSIPEQGPDNQLQLTLFTSNGALALVPKLLPSRIASRLKLIPRFECVRLVLQNVQLVDDGPSVTVT